LLGFIGKNVIKAVFNSLIKYYNFISDLNNNLPFFLKLL